MAEFCTHCGAALEPDALFCTSCGAPVESDDASPASETPTQAIPLQQMPPQPIPQSGPSGNAVPQDATQSPTGSQNMGNAYGNASVPSMESQPSVAPAPGAGAPGPQATKPNKSSKGKLGIPIIIAAVVVVLVLLGGVAYGVLRSGGNGGNAASSSSSSTAAPQTPTPSVSESAAGLDMDKLQSIVNSYSPTEAAVSVRPIEDGDEFDSQQANSKFVAAGFYLPVYLFAKDSGNASAMSSAESMMRTMSNDDGNTAIGDLGGLPALNGWSSGAGYGNTDFQRMFGDVAASNSGYENYTSASDATKMLVATAKAGGTDLMSFDLASEGVNAPSGTTLNGHRGQGIKNSYNFFVLMKTGKTDVAVAVLTQNMGKDRAAALTSDILAEVATEVK